MTQMLREDPVRRSTPEEAKELEEPLKTYSKGIKK